MSVSIRPFVRTDLEACYSISLATGLAGADASHLYLDPRLMGHIYMAPYVLLEPTLALVVEDEGGIAGFAVGAADTAEWEDRLERDWWPLLRAQYVDPADVPPEQQTPDQRRAFMIHRPTRTPPAVIERYPAHLHMNMLPRCQRRGVGSQLLARWLNGAQRHGAGALHVGVNRANTGALQFWAKRGFVELTLDGLPPGRTIWMGRDH